MMLRSTSRRPFAWRINLLCTMCGLFLTLAAHAHAAILLTVSGTRLTGPCTPVAGGIAVGGHAVPLDQIVCLQASRRIPLYVPQGIELTNGSILRGRVIERTSSAFIFRSDIFKKMIIPAGQVQCIILTTMAATDVSSLPPAPGAFLRNGTRLAGSLVWMDRHAIGFRTDGQILRIAESRLRCLVLRGPQALATGHTRTFLRLKDGDLWVAEHVSAGPKSLLAGRRQIPWHAVAALWVQGPAATPVTDLQVMKTGGAPKISKAEGAEAVPIYINRLRTGYLQSRDTQGCRYWESGFACRPGAAVHCQVGGVYKTLVAAVAVHGTTPVVVQVSGDGKVLLRQRINPGPAQWLHVALPALKVLDLQTLPGPATLLTPRVVWGDAFLIRN